MASREREPSAVPLSGAARGLKRCAHCGGEYDAQLRFCPQDGAVLRHASETGDLIGEVISDRYQVISQLGAGGMGQVYLAAHLRLGRRCALKVLKMALLADVDAVARFDREASNASRIAHPNVATIYDFGDAGDGVVYLAMELVEGEPLSALLRREHGLPARRALSILRQIADGLNAAHELGIVHRDLKPDNVMLGTNRDGSDCVKVVDFGIAKGVVSESQKITATGLIMGTPAYMSPEQLAGDPADPRSDLYSLGLIAFELFTGVLPFPAGQDAMLARLAMPPRSMSEAKGDVRWPPALQETLRRALAVSPANRHHTVRDFADALTRAVDEWLPPTTARHPRRDAEGFAAGGTDGARPDVARRRSSSSRKRLLALGLATLVAGTLAAGWNRLATRSRPAVPLRTEAVADHIVARAARGASGAKPAASELPSGVTGEAGRGGAPSVRSGAGKERSPSALALPSGATPATTRRAVGDTAVESARRELERLRRLTDPLNGSDENARAALSEISLLLPRLSSGADSIEAQYFAINAHLHLGEQSAACETLRRIEPRASSHPYLANAIRGLLADAAFECP